MKESIAVIGGGMTGIAAALELAKSGNFDVTLFEKEDKLGGLSSSYQWQDVLCDRFYHVILPSDYYLLGFVRELGLQSKLFWKNVKSGFYGEKKLVSFSSSADFLRFPFLTLPQKLRLALGILYVVSLKETKKLAEDLAADWLGKIFGRNVYKNFWEPLLRGKFGKAKDRVPSTLMRATIKRLYGARSSSRKQEKMGHVRGGYRAILDGAEKELSALEAKIMTASEVLGARIVPQPNPGKNDRQVRNSFPGKANEQILLLTKTGEYRFDKAVFTIPSPIIKRVLDGPSPQSYFQNMGRIEYLGVLCVLLILGRKLSPYYLVNLLDQDLPFTGVIESTNILSPADMGHKHLVYLPRYVTEDDPCHALSDSQIVHLFLEGLRKVFPDFRKDEVLHCRVFRDKFALPILGADSVEINLACRTPWPNIFLANSTLVSTSTVNNNSAIQVARAVSKEIISDRGEVSKNEPRILSAHDAF